MDAIIFLVRTLLQVLLITVFLLRVLLPLVRADTRNQLTQAVYRLTNPLVLPLRKVIPPVGKFDLASLVALILVQAATVYILWLLSTFQIGFSLGFFVKTVFMSLLGTVIRFYIFAIFLYALLSLIAPGVYSPASSLLTSICEPLMRPVRRTIPPIGGFDLSALFVIIGLQALHIAIFGL
ncbi:MAG: YggT family protein [Steroidobacteraceae bacterium]